MRVTADLFETADGSRPDATTLKDEVARRFPLAAFAHLSLGDAFEDLSGRPPPDGAAKAAAYVRERLTVESHGAPASHVERVRQDVQRLLSGNAMLIERMRASRPITVDLIPPGRKMSAYGYPKAAAAHAAGLFWDHPDWPRARVALRQDRLDELPHLVFHEMAHAVHYLAFTADERDRIYRVLVPTYRSRAAADEVFAIYSEREFSGEPSERDKEAPGVYGRARQRWSEDHVFTRFVRALYFPYKPFAGPRLGR